MKKLTFISSLLFVAFLSPVMADKKNSPFEWHGSATRIAPDGSLTAKEGVSNHPSWIVKPLKPAYSRAVSPSAGGSAADDSNTFAKCVGKYLCPLNWFKKK